MQRRKKDTQAIHPSEELSVSRTGQAQLNRNVHTKGKKNINGQKGPSTQHDNRLFAEEKERKVTFEPPKKKKKKGKKQCFNQPIYSMHRKPSVQRP